ncbi:MAG: HNH endonuclease, partial [Pelagibacterales bacterium]|nr:HNH endonuclease [Pelagibacterales bacterium]
MAKGLDCGTSFYICATENSIKKQRNAFLTVEGEASQVKRMLKRQQIPFVEKSGKVHIVGQHAFNYAQIFSGVELRRPMKSGLLNPTERDSLPILNAIIGELLDGKSKSKNEIVTYCVPSTPIDQERRVDYHEDVLRTIIEGYGYKAIPIEEAVALAYEGLVDNNLTGISISMGAGMCLRGDTKIPLLNGETKTIKELAENHADEKFWVYSSKEDGQVVPGLAWNPHKVKTTDKMLRLWFDNDEYLDCTPDHLIMVRDGNFKEAQDLTVGDSLMPLYRQEYGGKYRKVWNNKTQKWNNEHRLVWKQHNNENMLKDEIVHHIDYNAANNNPDNLRKMTRSDHMKLHRILAEYNTNNTIGKTYEEIYGKEKSSEIKLKKQLGREKWWNNLSEEDQDDFINDIRYRKLGKTNEELYGKEVADKMAKISSDTMKQTRADGKLGQYILTEEQLKKCQENGFGTYERAPEILEKNKGVFGKGRIPWNKGLTGDDYKKHYKKGFSNQTNQNYNHKLVKIEQLNIEEDVYDMTVDKYHNFAINSGIFVHNCNIAVIYSGISALSFSVSRGGDWNDENVSNDTGVSIAKVQHIKENERLINLSTGIQDDIYGEGEDEKLNVL